MKKELKIVIPVVIVVVVMIIGICIVVGMSNRKDELSELPKIISSIGEEDMDYTYYEADEVIKFAYPNGWLETRVTNGIKYISEEGMIGEVTVTAQKGMKKSDLEKYVEEREKEVKKKALIEGKIIKEEANLNGMLTYRLIYAEVKEERNIVTIEQYVYEKDILYSLITSSTDEEINVITIYSIASSFMKK